MDIQSKKILKAIARFLFVVYFCAIGVAVGNALGGSRVALGLAWVLGSIAFIATKPENKRAEFEYQPEPPVLNAQQQRRRDDNKTFGGD